jgi:magnesium transporter
MTNVKAVEDAESLLNTRPSEKDVLLELIQYNQHDYFKCEDLPINELLNHLKPDHINWINLDGLQDHSIINRIAEHFCLHTLLVEDIVDEHQPKSEEFDQYLFVTLKMLHRIDGCKISYEQISFVLGKDYLLSFQQDPGDFFEPFRERIRLDQGRVRKKKADYLLYRLIDIIVDNYYSVLDNIGEQIEEIEDRIYSNPTEKEFKRIQLLKKELIFLRKALYPLRDAIYKLVRNESDFIEESNERYFSDVYDHVVHLIDSMDTYRDLTSSLMDIHINTLNTRMNEVMKVLTVFSTIFMPLTFIVGVYGMNFIHMPELGWLWGYPAVWGIMIVIATVMIRYFRKKNWF